MKFFIWYFLLACILFGVLSLSLFLPGDYKLFGESFLPEFFIVPIITVGVSIIGTNMFKDWYTIPIIIFIVFNLFYFIFFQETYLFLTIPYTIIALLASTITNRIISPLNKEDEE